MDKVLIFDFDGVLANSIDPMLEYAQQVCEELGYPCIPTQNDLEVLERMEFSEYGLQLGIPPEKIEAFVARNFELFNTRHEPLQIFPGMHEVINRLSGSITLAMITGNSRIGVEKFLQAHELDGIFQAIFSAEDEGNRVEKILRLKASFHNPGTDFYFIGDAVSDIRAARQVGIKSVAVGWGHQSMRKLKRENPDFAVEKPVHLLDLFAGGSHIIDVSEY